MTSTVTSRHSGGGWGTVRVRRLLPPLQMREALRTVRTPQEHPERL